MRFRLLGALVAETEAGPVDLGPHKQRSVLAVLLLHANQIVSTERIIDLVWGERPPRTAEHSVHIYVSELRKNLSEGLRPDLIETHPPGYILNLAPESVDVLQFESLVKEGLSATRSGDLERGRTSLETALGLWIGEPLADFTYDEFAQEYIRSLRELRSDALEALAGISLLDGDLDSTRRLAREALEIDPLREEPRRLMMVALCRSGRQAEALRRFSEYRSLLADELGIDPSEGLCDLEERILFQDPSLGIPPAPIHRANPYLGLRPFSEDDTEVFFGRDGLVADVLDRLETGSGLVSIVGPSGSGKSSASRAGVVPELRKRGIAVTVLQPGARPLWELAATLDRAGFGSRQALLQRFETDARSLVNTVSRPLVLVVDQFEELFTLAEEETQIRFAELIVHAIRAPESPLKVIATLRADYYDRPLSIPVLTNLFLDSVVSVRPMSGQELERAIVEPARVAGAEVEPALLAQLVADMSEEPGALPLLQVTLFELFQLTEGDLTLAGYEKLGGLHGALAGGAEDLLSEFGSDGRDLIEQLMMRMVRKGNVVNTARSVALRELLELDVDSVLLQRVLEAFTEQRLLTFDRDSSGVAVVGMAHEYLISEWPRMVEWIEAHGEDLDRLRILHAATEDWIDAGRSLDYLLRGERLQDFDIWFETTSLRLTRSEAGFIVASLELRQKQEQQEREREAKEKALTRSARRRLWAFGVTVAVLAATITMLVVVLTPDPPPDVIVWYEGRGDASFGDLIAFGIDDGVEKLDLEVQEFTVEPTQWPQVAEPLAAGTRLAFLDVLYIGEEITRSLTSEYPETTFVFIDCAEGPSLAGYLDSLAPNVRCISHHNEEIGFVAGLAAGLRSETGHVGMIGGTDAPVIAEMRDGFLAGVRHVDPTMDIDVVYLSDDFLSGFYSPELGAMAANILYDDGADVIFHAAGGSGQGLFTAAAHRSTTGPNVWAIGVDIDQWEQLKVLGMSDADLALTRNHILTSAMKRLDVGIFEAMQQYVAEGTVEHIELGIWNGGATYATSGGHIDDIVPELEAAMAAVADGSVEIEVDYEKPVTLLRDLLFGRGG